MKRALRAVVFAALGIILTSQPADAAFWEMVRWLNDLSGPRMYGHRLDVPIVCWYEFADKADRDNQKQPPPPLRWVLRCMPQDRLGKEDNLKKVHRTWMLGLRAGYLANNREVIDPSSAGNTTAVISPANNIHVFEFGPSVTWSPTPIVDVRYAFEAFQFRGPLVDDFWVPTVDLGAEIFPGGSYKGGGLLGSAARGTFVGLHVQKILDSFDASRFGMPPETFTSKREWLWVFTIGVDFGR